MADSTKPTSIAHAFTLGDITVRQLDGLFSLNDLHKASGAEEKHQPSFFLRNDQIKALIEEIQSANSQTAVNSINGGKSRGTYACRELVIAYAAWISAAFHLKVIRVFLAVAAPQPTPYTVQPSDTLNEPQQIALRAMLESNVKRLPHEKQAGAMIKGWSKLKAHFGVPYRQIPASEFTEALSIIARHVSEWELVEDAAKQPEAAPKPNVFMQALAAARENALSYMNGYRQAVQSGQPGPRMDDIPGALLEGIVAEALMSSRFLAGIDPRTGQMHVQLVPQDASVFSFQSGDFGQAISAIPTRRLPELQDALSRRVARHLGSLGH